MMGDEGLAWERRNHNLETLWEPLHALGFCVVDEHGGRVGREDAQVRRPVVGLRRIRGPMRLPARTGFFTHSLIGNALVLLTGHDGVEVPTASGATITFEAIARQPNRHYLLNATPVGFGDVVLIRHGLTEANRRGIALGRSDGAAGWRGELVERFQRAAPADVVSWHRSTLLRTQQTALMFGIEHATPHGGLDEMDIGAAEGILESTVIESFVSAHLMYHRGDPFAAIVDESRGKPSPSAGECFVDVLIRVARCLEDELGAK